MSDGCLRLCGLTPRLTGAGARSAEGTNTGHKNGQAMASVGVRVEPTVRLGRVVEGVENKVAANVEMSSSGGLAPRDLLGLPKPLDKCDRFVVSIQRYEDTVFLRPFF